MPEFLELLPPAAAMERLLSHLPPSTPAIEMIPTSSALGRVVARPLVSPETLPAFARSTMDGYAVVAASTFGASESLPAYLTIKGEVPMGGAPQFAIQPGEAALIHTGGMLPAGADAVVILEHTQIAHPGELEVLRAVAEGENLIQAGEDIRAGELALPVGARLRAADIGALLALGVLEVPVARPPRVGILSSGDEVVPPDVKPAVGQVRDVNSYSISALVQHHGGMPVRYGILPDRAEALQERLGLALLENDLVVITAGSSASARDLTAGVIQEMGKPGVLVHGLHIRPGKPTILAVCDGKAIIGLPGNPVSALVIASLFVGPLVDWLQGVPFPEVPRATVQARLTINLSSQAGREEWLPVRLVRNSGGEYQAEPVFFKSSLIFSLMRADGLIHIPATATGIAVGEIVQVTLLSDF